MKTPTLTTLKPGCSLLKSPLWDFLISNREWYPKGLKTYLLLMVPQGIAAAAGVKRVFDIGEGFTHVFATYEDKFMRATYDPRDFRRVSKLLIDVSKNNPNWVLDYKNKFSELSVKFVKLADEVYKNSIPDDK